MSESEATDVLAKISNMDVESLIREPDLGSDFGFGQVRSEICEMHDRIVAVSVYFPSLSATDSREVARVASLVDELFAALGMFDPTGDGARRIRQDLLNRTIGLAEDVTRVIRPVILERRLGSAALDDLHREAELVVQSLRDTAGAGAVAKHAAAFKTELRNDRIQAAVWLLSSSGIAIILVWQLKQIPPVAANASVAQIVNHYAASLALVTVGLLFLTMFTRLFRQAMVRGSVNSHRVRSLETFEAFIQASEPGPVRDAIMLETARAIFSHVEASTQSRDSDGMIDAGLLAGLLKK